MKNVLTLRSLAILSFVIFFLPFMRMCSDDQIANSLEEQNQIYEQEEEKPFVPIDISTNEK